MAAILKHGMPIRSSFVLPCVPMSFKPLRNFSDTLGNEDLPNPPKLKDTAVSLSNKGFLRPLTPYQPRPDTKKQLFSLGKLFLGANVDSSTKIDHPNKKFKILAECHKVFKHSVPNSMLHQIETFGDIIAFYETPVITATPLDQIKLMKLPPNLHVQHDYIRFHPDTDVMFGGISAFPKSSTIVTGLKYKKKYMGYKAKTSWP